MIYIVSGFARSGTTMMMQSLIAGGLVGSYKEGNINLEWPRREFELLDLKADLDEKVCKLLLGRIGKIKEGPARVVVMRRDPEEIALSFMVASGGRSSPYANNPKMLTDRLDATVKRLKSQPDIFESVDELWYADVVKDPEAAFTTLKDNGWPIDVEAAEKIPVAKDEHQH